VQTGKTAMNRPDNKIARYLMAAGVMMCFTACGGGKSNGSAATAEPKNFSIKLVEVDVRRASNGEMLEIDTVGINTGGLTLR
jgi:hypothetical protein